MTNFADKTIWTGDNLDILRGMNSESVDLIYLDPPFNSNRNYAAPVGSQAAGAAFKDTWTLSDLDVAWMGLIADEQPAMYQVLQAAGLTHGKGMQSYLCMMGVRLLEMRRVLKDTGSIYLHCDPTASHYLKLLMDAVFGARQFRNEITWKRSHSHSSAKRYGPVHDTLLFYSKTDGYLWSDTRLPYNDAYIDRYFKFDDNDARGRYWTGDLTGSGMRNGLTGDDWRGFNPTDKGRHWMYPPAVLDAMDMDGRVYWPRTATAWPKLKRYLAEAKGVPLQDIIDDIYALQTMGGSRDERIGFPTQKPLALLERIIKASSNEGDMVLDPFCGCATACVAAENLGRKWVGIDLSSKAVELVNMRLQQTMGSLFHHGYVTHRTDISRRTDIDAPIPYRQNKHVLFGQQEGLCGGCKEMFPFRNFTIDHVVPQSRGGTDHLDNLQLLCGACNSLKGDRPQEYLVARLKEMAVI